MRIMNSGSKAWPGSWIEINLSALRENFRTIRGLTRPKAGILAVVKADAYGHGLIPVARELIRMKVEALGVGTVEEGILIRTRIKEAVPIVVLLGAQAEESPACFHYRLTPVVYSYPVAEKLHQEGLRRKRPLPVHLKVDTGMGRLGVPWKEFGGFLQHLRPLKGIVVTGLTSHFGRADEKGQRDNRLQWNRFKSALEQARQLGFSLSENHLANSAALLNDEKTHLDYVRPGILLYGSNPTGPLTLKEGFDLKPVMTFKSRILQVKKIPAGVGVSYGGTYRTTRAEWLAVIAAGYANGYLRQLSNRAEVLIRGHRFPVTGRVCMNLTVVRIPAGLNCSPGEEAVLLGTQERERIPAEELARQAGTIPYEIFCLLGLLNPRTYLTN